jgi:hypothetical protein
MLRNKIALSFFLMILAVLVALGTASDAFAAKKPKTPKSFEDLPPSTGP